MRFVTALILVFSGALMLASASGKDAENPSIAPNWILPNTAGKTISLYEQSDAGYTTVMVFWSTWCHNCQKLLTQLNSLNASLEEQPVVFYLMNLWEDGDPVSYLKEHGIQIETILQAEHVAQRYNIKLTPGIVVVGSDKRIQYIRTFEQKDADIFAELKRIIVPAAPASN